MITVIIVLTVFSIPLAGIITTHLEKQTKLNHAMLKDQLELERLKHENFLLETNKMKLEVEKRKWRRKIIYWRRSDLELGIS
ncbi:hypothetical protein ACTNDN_23300 [Niallia sp. HCP3S3_B10]|uniref:Uncharacterized protein n=1 Tax=Niallia hominis TaxID=3133173 RepID=A0ABV1F6M5_9BACI|nr:hypothetical protein [Bacillus sp. T2.9-1]CAI9385669.1 hypothetical protein BACSP_00060 [Bacillus sp. T2.9-1]